MNVRDIKGGFDCLSFIVPCDGTSENMRNVRHEWSNVSIKLYDDYGSEVCNVRLRLRVGENDILLYISFKQAFFFC